MRVIGQDLTKLKSALTHFPLQFEATISYEENNQIITLDNDNLFRVLYYYDGDILKSNMQCLEFDCEYNIEKNTNVNFQINVLYENEYITLDYGIFKVISVEKLEDENTYLIKCADALIGSMKDYEDMNITYPITLGNYLDAICNHLGLTLASSVFPNSTRIIPNELYLNMGYKFRDVLDEISQCAGSSICINNNNEVEVKSINETNDTIDEDYINQSNVTFKEKYGPINSIVLSRSAESDNVYIKDDESIEENGLYEIKIIDNQIMNDNNRSDYLQEIANNLFGLTYYEHNYASSPQGIFYYNFLDKYNVSIGNKTYQCLMLNDDVILEDGVSETLAANIPNQAKTDYSKASKTDKQLSRAMLIVDKINGEIDAKVDKDGIIAELNLAIDNGQGIVNIKGNNFILDSDNAKIDIYGNVEFEDARFRGGNILLQDDGTEEGASLKIQTPSRYTEEIVVGDVLQNKRILFNLKNFTYNQIASMCTPQSALSRLGFEAYTSNSTQQKPYEEIMWFTINEVDNENQYFSMWIFHNGDTIEEINRIKFVNGKIEDNFVFEVPNNYFGAISNIVSSNDIMNNLSLLTYEVVRETSVSGNGVSADIKADYDFTSNDVTRVQGIIARTIQPTPADFKRYDINKDGIINALDLLKIQKYIIANIGITNPGKLILNTQDIEDNILLLDGEGNEKLSIGLINGIRINDEPLEDIFVPQEIEEFTSKVNFNESVANNTHFYRQGNVVYVHYQGAGKTHSDGATLCTIPSGYRPRKSAYAPFTKNNNAYGSLNVNTNGAMSVNMISSTSASGRIYANFTYII